MPRRSRRPAPKPARALNLGGSHFRRDGNPKVGYGSRGMAEVAAQELLDEEKLELTVYQCRECHQWHLASSGD
jgi:hypothetical protein